MEFTPNAAGPIPAATLGTAWPQAGTYTATDTDAAGNSIKMEFELTAASAEERLTQLEYFNRRLPLEARYLEKVLDFNHAVRTSFNATVGWNTSGYENVPTRRIPDDVVGVATYLGEYDTDAVHLEQYDIVADGIALIGNEAVLPYYVYVATGSCIESLEVPARNFAKQKETSRGVSSRDGEKQIVINIANRIGSNLVSRGLCDEVVYERFDSETLHIELRKRGRVFRVLALGLRVYASLREIAYGPSRGLLYAPGDSWLATPTLQFLMAYGLAVDSPVTSHGVRVALSAGFEACDVLLPYVQTFGEKPDGLHASIGQYTGASGRKEHFLNRGPRICRAANAPAPLPAWFNAGVDNVRLIAEERYGKIRPRSPGSADRVIYPEIVAIDLNMQATNYMIEWMGRVRGGRQYQFMASLDELGATLELASRGLPQHHDPSFGTDSALVFARINERAFDAAKHLFPEWEPEKPASVEGTRGRAEVSGGMAVGVVSADTDDAGKANGADEDNNEAARAKGASSQGHRDRIRRLVEALAAVAKLAREFLSADP